MSTETALSCFWNLDLVSDDVGHQMLEHAQCFRYRAPEKRRVYEPRERITVGSIFGGLLTIGSTDLSEELGVDVVYFVEKDGTNKGP